MVDAGPYDNVYVNNIAPASGSTVGATARVQVAESGVTKDTDAYAVFGVTRANEAVNNSYIGLTKQSTIPWGIGIGSDNSFIVGVSTSSPARTITSPVFKLNSSGILSTNLVTLSGFYGIGIASKINGNNDNFLRFSNSDGSTLYARVGYTTDGYIKLPDGKIRLGADVDLYRSSADTLTIPDNIIANQKIESKQNMPHYNYSQFITYMANDAAPIPETTGKIRFADLGEGGSWFDIFGIIVTEPDTAPMLGMSHHLMVKKDAFIKGQVVSLEGCITLHGGYAGWAPTTNPLIWLSEGGIYGSKNTLEIRIVTAASPRTWGWGNLSCGDIMGQGSLYLTGNTNGYLWNNGGYIRQSGGNGFVADGTITVGTYASGGAGSAVYFNSYHQLCQGTSLQEYKTDIKTLDDASWIFSLRPVTFDWKDNKDAQVFGRQIGLIAEEVQPYAPLLTFNDEQTGQLRGVLYEKLAVPMLVELQKLRREVDKLKATLEA